MPTSILLGRALALCLHPRAAWRVLPRVDRALVVVVYGLAGFVTTLAALVLF